MSENKILRSIPHQKQRKSEAPAGETLTVIGSGMEIVGSLESTGLVNVAGRVLGNVNAAGQVRVARGGHVDGDVHAREAVLDGEITGSIVAERVEVQASAVIHGDITASKLIIHEGAVLNVELVPSAPMAQQRGAA